MFILDTNVISELMRADPSARVLGWVDAQPARTLFITTITQAEILFGLTLLPQSRRHATLATAAHRLFTAIFAGRILPFDEQAATAYAAVAATARSAGRTVTPLDLQIAAIALARDLAVATRNTRDFAGLGISLIDPWASPATV